ncbi:peptidase A8 [Marichromatium purpuratum 984]|uniref:Lipoprotein signal peptidase n=1 Tax=Marichromatium purpuratum 984 TaxID=765910 RepID=W0E153_MARPU|nr:signal peptidase II [Marichromatium purpuratum]AHF04437.1 peptidase A8 [Marichromatium purpuratum 984]
MAESGARSWLWLSLLVLVLDQASKWLVYGLLDPFQVVALTETLHLTLVFNEGAAFSLLAGAGGWQRWLFSLIAVAVSVALVIWLGRLRRDQRWSAAALALLLGGALGNLIDRVVLGHVIDFVQVYLPFLPMSLFNPWPAFNVADSAISIGVVILLIVTLFEQPEPRHQD